MINVCFFAVIVYIGVGFDAVGTAYGEFVDTIFPMVILGAV